MNEYMQGKDEWAIIGEKGPELVIPGWWAEPEKTEWEKLQQNHTMMVSKTIAAPFYSQRKLDWRIKLLHMWKGCKGNG
jgi:hypothetical protein